VAELPEELTEGTVTVLFTDAVGSTELRTTQGDEAAHRVLRGQDELIRKQIAAHSGREVKGTGDGVLAAFGSARRAVTCAAEIQRALEEQSRQNRDANVAVRIGVNSGEVSEEGGDLFGAAVNAAARVAAKAKGGEILVSGVVKQLAGKVPDVSFVDRGRFRLKGFDERWQLFEVVWQAAGPAIAAPLAERASLVGREAELAKLRRHLDDAIAGRGGLVMIGGEPGIGKTRLTQELADEATRRGMLALFGRCYESEGAPPYIPFVEILEAGWLAESPEVFRQGLGEDAAEVARILPRLRQLFPDIPPPLELPPEQERHVLFNAVRDSLARGATIRPLLLVLDDLHWADEPTLLLGEHVAQRLREMPVLVLGTYRDVELDVERPLARTLEAFLRQGLTERISLKRLPESDVAHMVAGLAGQEPPASLVQAIYAETEGNPFFVQEVFKYLADAGRLFDAGGHFRADLAIAQLDVPEGIRLVVGRRLARLGDVGRNVLSAASVIGRDFSYRLLEAIAEVDPDTLLDVVDAAERAYLITSIEEGGEVRFRFAHELIRQTLVSGLSLPRRQRLHLRVAEALERLYPDAVDERAADLAQHLFQAGEAADKRKTAKYLVAAGNQALAAAAFEEALRVFEQAGSLDLSERLEEAEIHQGLGMAQRSLGRWDDALVSWDRAMTTYEHLGETDALGPVAVDAAQQLGWAGRFAEMLQIASRGLAAIGNDDTRERARLQGIAGLTFSLAGNVDVGEQMVGEAVQLQRDYYPEDAGYAAYAECVQHFCCFRVRQVHETGLRGCEELRRIGALWDVASLLGFVQTACGLMARFEEMERIGLELDALADRLGHEGARILLARNRVLPYRSAADFAAIEKAGWEVVARDERIGVGWPADGHTVIGLAAFWRGDWDVALHHLDLGAGLEAELPTATGGNWAYALLPRAYAGDRDSALEILERRKEELAKPGQTNTRTAWAAALVALEVLAQLGERERAAAMYPLAKEALETGTVLRFYDGRPLDAIAGMAASAAEDWETAEEHFRTVLDLAAELRLRIEQPEVRRFYSQMLIDRNGPGDRQRARQLLDEAITMYTDIGMPRHKDMARSVLARL
jgi:class 3 adenylate cyclase/tetratricopeptide (TPR) repeat protein